LTKNCDLARTATIPLLDIDPLLEATPRENSRLEYLFLGPWGNSISAPAIGSSSPLARHLWIALPLISDLSHQSVDPEDSLLSTDASGVVSEDPLLGILFPFEHLALLCHIQWVLVNV
jgi:hypothetical protein